MVDRDRVTKLFMDLVNINSPSKNEREVADYLKKELAMLGFEVEEDNAGELIGGNTGNLIAFKRGNLPEAKSVFFCCHMDTVQPTDGINAFIEDGEIKTDGSTILGADDKAGIAAVIEGLRSVVESKQNHGDIQVIFNVSEEIGLLGSKNLEKSRIRADYGFVLDTQKPVAGITWSAPSHDSIKVTIRGKAAHAGIAPEQGVSAIVAASKAISKMKLGRIDDETTANAGVIQGGKARNIIPDLVYVLCEARSRNQEKLVEQTLHMKDVFEQEAQKLGAVADVEIEREYTSFRFTKNDEVVKLAMAASERLGITPSFQEGGGGSDANIYNSMGIPSLVIGVGYDGAHTSSERISVDDLETAAKYCEALVNTAASGEV